MSKRYKQIFFRVSIIFSLLATIVVLFAWYKNAEPSIELIFAIYCFTSIVFPLFILLLGWISETYFKRQMELIFKRPPLLNIQADKFEILEIKSKSIWFPTTYVLNGNINGYNIFFNLQHDEFIKIQVTFPFCSIDNETRKKITESLKHLEFKVNNDNVFKTYRKRKLINMTNEELVTELEFVTTILNIENIKTAEIGWC